MAKAGEVLRKLIMGFSLVHTELPILLNLTKCCSGLDIDLPGIMQKFRNVNSTQYGYLLVGSEKHTG
jgi:hypothetical protein